MLQLKSNYMTPPVFFILTQGFSVLEDFKCSSQKIRYVNCIKPNNFSRSVGYNICPFTIREYCRNIKINNLD